MTTTRKTRDRLTWRVTLERSCDEVSWSAHLSLYVPSDIFPLNVRKNPPNDINKGTRVTVRDRVS